MAQTLDLGTRIELVSMDTHFQEISIALYRQQHDATTHYLVHSYSTLDGAKERIEFIKKTMIALGGMEQTTDGLLYFACGAPHELACKRLFLEACKHDPATIVTPRPLTVFDKKGECNLTVTVQEDGSYQAAADSDGAERRVAILIGGLTRLAQLEEKGDAVAFACGHQHDVLIGLLLGRALNVRAAIREAELNANRGMLAAPSQQN